MKRWIDFATREWPLFLYWAFTVCLYSTLSLFRHWHFGSNGYDLGIFDQVIWHFSRFERPTGTVTAFPNMLGDHFYPALILLAPLYWICSRVEMILVAQAVLLTLPVFPICLFAQKRLGRARAYFFAVCYGLLWEVQITAEFDFHEICIAVPAVAFAIYFADEGRWKSFFAAVFLLMMAKEDMVLLVFFIGLLLVLRKEYKKGLVLSAVSLAFFYFEIKMLIPYFGAKGYSYWNYAQLGQGPMEALGTCLTHPLKVFLMIFSNSTKIYTLKWLFIPFFFLAFFSPWVILTIPLIGERMLSDSPNLWIMHFHYSAVAAPVICLASVDGLWRLSKRFREPRLRDRMVTAVTVCMLVFNLDTAQRPRFPLRQLTDPAFYHFTDIDRAGYRALGLIPADASVLAQSSIVPHLSHRETITMIDKGSMGGPSTEDYVIGSFNESWWPLDSRAELEKVLGVKEKAGYKKIFDQEGWFVLKRGDLAH